MYVTAQRVQSPHNTTGINSFLYRHAGEELREIDWAAPPIHLIQTQHPGELVAQVYQVPAGGNKVLSYLDVAAANATNWQQVETALDRYAKIIQLHESAVHPIDYIKLNAAAIASLGLGDDAVQSKIPPAVVIDQIVICFDGALTPKGEARSYYLKEFEALKLEVLSLLKRHPASDETKIVP